jgi:hypothetical protein
MIPDLGRYLGFEPKKFGLDQDPYKYESIKP